MFKSELAECQKTQEFCNQSLLNITEERNACTEEVKNTKLTLDHIKVRLTFRGKELSRLQMSKNCFNQHSKEERWFEAKGRKPS